MANLLVGPSWKSSTSAWQCESRRLHERRDANSRICRTNNGNRVRCRGRQRSRSTAGTPTAQANRQAGGAYTNNALEFTNRNSRSTSTVGGSTLVGPPLRTVLPGRVALAAGAPGVADCGQADEPL